MKAVTVLAALLLALSATPSLAFPDEALMSTTIHPAHDPLGENASYIILAAEDDDFDELWTAKAMYVFVDQLETHELQVSRDPASLLEPTNQTRYLVVVGVEMSLYGLREIVIASAVILRVPKGKIVTDYSTGDFLVVWEAVARVDRGAWSADHVSFLAFLFQQYVDRTDMHEWVTVATIREIEGRVIRNR